MSVRFAVLTFFHDHMLGCSVFSTKISSIFSPEGNNLLPLQLLLSSLLQPSMSSSLIEYLMLNKIGSSSRGPLVAAFEKKAKQSYKAARVAHSSNASRPCWGAARGGGSMARQRCRLSISIRSPFARMSLYTAFAASPPPSGTKQ